MSRVKTETNKYWDFILDLVVKPAFSEKSKEELLSTSWQDDEITKTVFKSPKDFMNSLVQEIDSKFTSLNTQNAEAQLDFFSVFSKFLGSILDSLAGYLPLENDMVEIIDFVELKDTYPSLKEKISKFCEKFDIIKEEMKSQFKQELIQLKGILQSKILFYKETSIDTLHLWDLLEKEEKLEILPRIARIAETLPTSSAPVEQSFSIVKLLKTDIRNSLTEESLEGLMLVGEEFREKQYLNSSKEMLDRYNIVKADFYLKKVKNHILKNQIQVN